MAYVPGFIRAQQRVENMSLSEGDKLRIQAGDLVYQAAVEKFGKPVTETLESWSHGEIRAWITEWIEKYVKLHS